MYFVQKEFFSQLNVLKLHQKRHIDVKNHVCFKCEKTFGTDAEMKRHQRIHIVKNSLPDEVFTL